MRKIDITQYVPILKWQQAEYQALYRSDSSVKERITPFFIVPPIGYDFEEKREKKTLIDHIAPVAKRIKGKWGRQAILGFEKTIEDQVLDNGQSAISYVFDDLRRINCCVVPAINGQSSEAFVREVANIFNLDMYGVAVKVSVDDIASGNLYQTIKKLREFSSVGDAYIDLIVDLGRPSYEPYSIFAKILTGILSNIEDIRKFRSFVVVGLSLNLAEIKKPGGIFERHEWNFYKILVDFMKDIRIPSFGDYTVEYPEFIMQDMRKMKPAGKIVYSTEDSWLVPKGGSFRDAPEQAHSHCDFIIKSGYYSGEDYTAGDKRIYLTAEKKEGHGNLGTWKQVGISHHLRKVTDQLAIFHAR